MIMPRDTRPRGDTKPRGASRVGAFLFAAGVFFAGYAAGTCSAAHGAAQLAARQQRQAMREVLRARTLHEDVGPRRPLTTTD